MSQLTLVSLLADIKAMIDSGAMETVKRVVPAVLEPIKSTIEVHSKTLVDLERSANWHNSQISELGAIATKLTAGVPTLLKKCQDLEGELRLNNL